VLISSARARYVFTLHIVTWTFPSELSLYISLFCPSAPLYVTFPILWQLISVLTNGDGGALKKEKH